MTQGLIKKGKIWSLDSTQEIVLKQTWAILLKFCGFDLSLTLKEIELESSFTSSKAESGTKYQAPENVDIKDIDSIISSVPAPSDEIRSLFIHVHKGLPNDKPSPLCFITGNNDATTDSKAKLLVKNAEKHPLLVKFSPYELHQAIFSAARNDLLDNTLLRYVRARKFHLNESMKMLTKCFEWRYKQYPVDKWLFEGDSKIFEEKNTKLIESFKLNQAYLRGHDKSGSPIIVINVKEHLRHNCPDSDFERLICMIIEWVRLDLKEYQYGSDGASILFDMSGFSMKNADFAAIKFLVTSFEANYPECLSHIWIHSAPWIFNTAWRVIRPWLDPVVASKITFTSKVTELDKYIDPQHIPEYLGGLDDFKMKYIEPTAENSGKLPQDENYHRLIKQRETIAMQFVESTIRWIEAKTPDESRKYLDIKINLGIIFAQNFIKLDPYIRTRGVFDRNLQLGKMGV